MAETTPPPMYTLEYTVIIPLAFDYHSWVHAFTVINKIAWYKFMYYTIGGYILLEHQGEYALPRKYMIINFRQQKLKIYCPLHDVVPLRSADVLREIDIKDIAKVPLL